MHRFGIDVTAGRSATSAFPGRVFAGLRDQTVLLRGPQVEKAGEHNNDQDAQADQAIPLRRSPGGTKERSPGREPGDTTSKMYSPGGAKDSLLESVAPPGLKYCACRNPGLTPGATLFRPS